MVRKRTVPCPVVDEVVNGCLDRIRNRDMVAVGVLADYLEEKGLPLAKEVRALYTRLIKNVNWWEQADMSRRRGLRWEKIAMNKRYTRRQIGLLFRRKWKSLPLEAFKRG